VTDSDYRDFEDVGSGRQLKRDADGKIVGSRLDPGVAAEMARSKAFSNQGNVFKLLRDRGVEHPDDDEGLMALARVAISGRAGAVGAMRYLDFLTGHGSEKAQGEQHEVKYMLNDRSIVMLDGAMFRRVTADDTR
jgi:hypothetical protein